MHKSGIFLGVLIILLGLGAFYLTARFLDTRHAWLKRLEKGDQDLVALQDSLTKLRSDLDNANAEYDRVMLGWDFWREPVTVQVDGANQSITVNAGPEFLTQLAHENKPATPLIYAFQPGANGEFEFVGEFLPTRIAAGNSTLKANWKLRPNEIASWRPGNGWRLRTRIPLAEKVRLDLLGVQFTTQDQLLAARTADLAQLEQKLTPSIETLLSNREGELLGFENLEDSRGKLPDEAIDGVIKSLVKEEEARNAALAEADRLRHDLLDAIELYERIHAANQKATAAAKPAPATNVSQR